MEPEKDLEEQLAESFQALSDFIEHSMWVYDNLGGRQIVEEMKLEEVKPDFIVDMRD